MAFLGKLFGYIITKSKQTLEIGVPVKELNMTKYIA